MSTKLSDHFTLEEFIASDTAKDMGNDNHPTDEHMKNLIHTAQNMEHVRSILGDKPITIKSGYRNPVVNKAVNGVPNSDHAKGFAIDFTHSSLSPLKAAHILADSGLVFDQLILESSRNIVHISFAPRLRKQVLTQPKGAGTSFQVGLPALK